MINTLLKVCSIAILLSVNHNINAQFTSWIVGSSANVNTNPQAGILLAGGASDNDDAMSWMLSRADGGDIVVLRASGTDGYNSYLYNLGSVNSVETILINSRSIANNTTVEQKIRDAEALFIAGGDQADYVNYWKDTRVEDAINYLINTKGVTVGGTSAGCAIQGKVYFDAINGTVTSNEALGNPYRNDVSIDRNDFLNHSILANTITDTHYDNPDRRGRHLTFMARMVKDWNINARGIGVDEYTAVCIEPSGTARVFGNASYDDYAYFLQKYGGNPETCVSGSSLTWNRSQEAVLVYKVKGNASGSVNFNLNTWESGNGGTWEFFYANNGSFGTAPSSGPGGGGNSTDLSDYCSSSGSDTYYEWIDRVDVANVNNRSGDDNGYGDYSNLTLNLSAGSTYDIDLYPGFGGSSAREYWRVWIDLNYDGDFNDSGEQLLSRRSRNTIRSSITIPSGTASGTTFMRVSMSYNGYPGTCSNFAEGEVEDYRVSIGSGSRSIDEELTPILEKKSLSIYPNPVEDVLHVSLGADQVQGYELYNLSGALISARRFLKNTDFDLELEVPAGVYWIKFNTSGGSISQKIIKK